MALPDLDTRSVLNVVAENFERVGLKTYAIRMIYAGEHNLKKDEIIKLFAKTVNDVNSSYCEINVTGLLLVYDSYFVHILEGSEDTVHRQLRFLLKHEEQWIKRMANEDYKLVVEDNTEEAVPNMLEHPDDSKTEKNIFRRLKSLMVYHSIQTDVIGNACRYGTHSWRPGDPNQIRIEIYYCDGVNRKPLLNNHISRMFSDWRALTARPPSLVGNLDVFGPFKEHVEQLRIFLDKIRKLCILVNNNPDLSFEGLSAVDPKIEALPEVTLLDFLLESQYMLELRKIVHLHRRVDDYVFYFENVWPLPTHYTPRLLYKLKIDDSFVEPLPVMPWEIVKKDVDEEGKETERDDDQSIASSVSD